MKLKLMTAGFLALVLPVFAHADLVQIESTGISFEAPADFMVYNEEQISQKWPNERAPKWAVGNENGRTTIAYDIKPHDISDAPLEKVKESFEQIFERMVPGLEWIERKVITLNNKEWIFFEMKSNAIDTDIHNIMLTTSYGKEMLVFNFNSTVEEFPAYEEELRNSISSIQIKN